MTQSTEKIMEIFNKLSSEKKGTSTESTKDKLDKIYNYLNKKINNVSDNFLEAIKLVRTNQKAQEVGFKNAISEINFQEFSSEQKKFINLLINKKIDEYVNKWAFTSKARIRENQTVSSRKLNVLKTRGTGVIDQILCVSDNTDFTIMIFLDDNVLFEKNFSYFQDNQEVLENISAFLDGGKYFLSIRKLAFQEQARIGVYSGSTTIFEQIMVKYTIRDDIPV